MKGSFIPELIKAIIKEGKEFYEVWQWQPLYYKGIHVSGYDYRKAKRWINNLENRAIVRRVAGDKYKFTPKGKKWFARSVLKYYGLRYSKWDNKWRVVIFDIPEELHTKRNQLRTKLKNLGFYMLQKSIFVIPYPCEDELIDICKKLKVGNYVDIITADSIGFKEEEIKKFFSI